MKKDVKPSRSQVSMEYIIIMGFVTFVLIGIVGIALIYSNSIKDRIRIVQVYNCADKIISTSESIFYMGHPSKATISCYFPENVKQVEILENSVFITVQTSSGLSKMAFFSNVPISGNINPNQGIKNIQIEAGVNETIISSV